MLLQKARALRDRIENYHNKYVVAALIGIMLIVRVLFGWANGLRIYGFAFDDDMLFIHYSALSDHFLNPNYRSLEKTISYALYLAFNRHLGISLAITNSLLWCIAALLVGYMCVYVFKKKTLGWASFLYVLFLPVAFDTSMGLRIYRNAIMAPLLFIFIALLCIILYRLLFETRRSAKDILITALIMFVAGALFSFYFYLSEAGTWLFFLQAGFSLLLPVSYITLTKLKKAKLLTPYLICVIAIAALPFAQLASITTAYRAINFHYFGTDEIENRTSGELGRFVGLIYQIEVPDRNGVVWTPKDAIAKAFAASPTLQSLTGLEESIYRDDRVHGSIDDYPICGDTLGWIVRENLDYLGYWKDDATIKATFKKVNSELEEAFANGTLVHAHGIRLSNASIARTPAQVVDLVPYMANMYLSHFVLRGYNPLRFLTAVPDDPADTELVLKTTHDQSAVQEELLPRQEFVMPIDIALFWIYRGFNALILLTLIYGAFLHVKSKAQGPITPEHVIWCIVVAALLLISLVYTLGIAWYCEWIYHMDHESYQALILFYTPCLPVFVTMAALICFGLRKQYPEAKAN